MAIVLDGSTIRKVGEALRGKKTHIGVAVGAMAIIANHFQLLPEVVRPSDLDPNSWLTDLYKLFFVSTARSAIGQVEKKLSQP